ncbi:hypothetical protein M2408_003207 [Sphingobacterium sp. BIGb0165]|nr:hypothetical protein [Sphingobacterium sp. BIGb0165]
MSTEAFSCAGNVISSVNHRISWKENKTSSFAQESSVQQQETSVCADLPSIRPYHFLAAFTSARINRTLFLLNILVSFLFHHSSSSLSQLILSSRKAFLTGISYSSV